MHDAYIDCVKKDWQGIITHVGIGGRVYNNTRRSGAFRKSLSSIYN